MSFRDKISKENVKRTASNLGRKAYVSARRNILPNEDDKRHIARTRIRYARRQTGVSRVNNKLEEERTIEKQERAKQAKARAEIDKARAQSRKARSEAYGGALGGNFGGIDMFSMQPPTNSRNRRSGGSYGGGGYGGIGGDFSGPDLSMFDMSAPRKKNRR